jgi:hypothetical protein
MKIELPNNFKELCELRTALTDCINQGKKTIRNKLIVESQIERFKKKIKQKEYELGVVERAIQLKRQERK